VPRVTPRKRRRLSNGSAIYYAREAGGAGPTSFASAAWCMTMPPIALSPGGDEKSYGARSCTTRARGAPARVAHRSRQSNAARLRHHPSLDSCSVSMRGRRHDLAAAPASVPKPDEIPELGIQCRPELPLVDLAHRIDPLLRGWINYYGRYAPSALIPLLQYVNQTLLASNAAFIDVTRGKGRTMARGPPPGACSRCSSRAASSLDLPPRAAEARDPNPRSRAPRPMRSSQCAAATVAFAKAFAPGAFPARARLLLPGRLGTGRAGSSRLGLPPCG
jgi:Group II intron, maturase-specific domain